jgi:uncharacterized protein
MKWCGSPTCPLGWVTPSAKTPGSRRFSNPRARGGVAMETSPTTLTRTFLMGMRGLQTNERDQRLVHAAASNAAANLLRFLPSLGVREALAFGAGMVLPTRFTFHRLPEQLIPRSEATRGLRCEAGLDDRLIDVVIEQWRGAMTRGKPT